LNVEKPDGPTGSFPKRFGHKLTCHIGGEVMTEEHLDRIAKLLYRISDRSERDEVTREIAKVLHEEDPSFDERRFYHHANVEYSGDS
jgi:hypothetical protein